MDPAEARNGGIDEGTPFSGCDAEAYAGVRMEQLRGGELDSVVAQFEGRFDKPCVLDLGAGPGTWEVALQRLSPSRVVWHDISEEYLAIAKSATAGLDNVEFRLGDLNDFSGYSDGEFDIIICLLALYHARDEVKVLCEAYRTLRPGGCIYIESHNFWRTVSDTKPWNWRFVPHMLFPAVYALTGRKIHATAFHVEGWLKRQARKIGFVEVYWRPKSRRTFQALLEKPAI